MEETKNLIRLSFIILFITTISLIVLNVYTIDKIKDLEINHNINSTSDNIITTLDNINEKCNSTFFTKKWKDDNYYIYSNQCNNEGFCKSIYIPLEECLKKV